MTSWSRSGSRRSARPVEPVTSANRIVTMRRSWPDGAAVGSPTGLPQAGQNRAPSGNSDPQRGHARVKEAPHAAQNRASSEFLAPQAAHVFTASESIVGVARSRPRLLVDSAA